MRYIKIIAVFMATLVMSMPFVNAATIKEFIYDANGNRVTGDGF